MDADAAHCGIVCLDLASLESHIDLHCFDGSESSTFDSHTCGTTATLSVFWLCLSSSSLRHLELLNHFAPFSLLSSWAMPATHCSFSSTMFTLMTLPPRLEYKTYSRIILKKLDIMCPKWVARSSNDHKHRDVNQIDSCYAWGYSSLKSFTT